MLIQLRQSFNTAEIGNTSPPHIQEHLVSVGKKGSAQDIVDQMIKYKIKFACKDSEMDVASIRRHLRILRRLASATVDANNPTYEYSALYFLDKNEETFGRKAEESLMQESCRTLDNFQASLPDLSDLRNACEALHILQLRGHKVKLTGRSVTEQARALVHYNKIPNTLIPRFPVYEAYKY